MRRLWAGLLVVGLLWPGAVSAQPAKDPSREAMLQTIGMLAGQGLVLGHEALVGLAARHDKRLVRREEALQTLADMARYTELVLAVFTDRLMGRLAPDERRDLGQLIGYYRIEGEAVAALAAFVGGEVQSREAFDASLGRLAAIIRQISLGRSAP
ncbi:hypothetical protein [Solidesulfovibrio sp.]